MRQLLAGYGLYEVVPYAFISPEAEEKSRAEHGVEISNPLTREASIMRGSMLPSLLETVNYNISHGLSRWLSSRLAISTRLRGDPLPSQTLRVAGALAGKSPALAAARRRLRFLCRQRCCPQLLADLGIEAQFCREPHSSCIRPLRRSVCRRICLGHFGQVPAITANWKLDAEVMVFDLDFPALVQHSRQIGGFAALHFTAVRRDLAVRPMSRQRQSFTGCYREAGGELLEELECFDVYGGNLDPQGRAWPFRWPSGTRSGPKEKRCKSWWRK